MAARGVLYFRICRHLRITLLKLLALWEIQRVQLEILLRLQVSILP